ncbi:MAG TPA: hypothetical protein VF461_08425, partial [Gemmatimonadaceae bacterium]
MKPRLIGLTVAGLAMLAVAACSDSTGSASPLSTAALSAALNSVPISFGDLTTSFIGASADDAPAAGLWLGGGREARFDHGDFMGGGIQDAFIGGIAFEGRGGGRGPFGGPFAGGLGCLNSSFDAASGRVVCPDRTRNGITVKRSTQFKDAGGNVQQAFDTLTTNSVNTQSQTSGTITFDRAADSLSGDDRGGNRGPGGGFGEWGRGRGEGGRLLGDTSRVLTATTTINSSSSRTVTGLGQGSTKRTVDGATGGTETTTGTSSRGKFTASRTVGDTTTGLVIPIASSNTGPAYPTAGTTVRSITATLQYENEAAVSLTRREVVTYDGSTTAKVTITENGTTK